MRKVYTIVGTRPEIIKLSEIIKRLDLFFENKIIHTGQHYDYELNEVFFKDLNIRKPDYFLNSAAKDKVETISKIFSNFNKLLKKEIPDAILILGDTNSTLISIVGKFYKIPIFHLEAGNRCFDQRVPEEINRKIVDHISDINLTFTNLAKNYLSKEGIAEDRIIKVGSPLKEVIFKNRNKIKKSKILKRLNLKKNNYFLVSFHREEHVEINFKVSEFIRLMNNLSQHFKIPIILSTHFRLMEKIKYNKIKLEKNIIISKPFGFIDYMKLQINSKLVMSDSGSITEESSILNFDAVNLRETHERPEGMEEGSVIMTGLNFNNILSSINILDYQKKDKNLKNKIVKDYDTINVSIKVCKIIDSYIDFVNSFVWKRNDYKSKT